MCLSVFPNWQFKAYLIFQVLGPFFGSRVEWKYHVTARIIIRKNWKSHEQSIVDQS